MYTKHQPKKIGRRDFLRRALVASAGLSAFPYIIPSSALGKDGAIAPSNRIVMGCLGVGSQGRGNLEGFLELKKYVQIVAVCDVDRGHRSTAQKMVDGAYDTSDCADYNDFRELLARKDLDALSIALPDHWHAIPVILGAQRGLHMYAEKPLALTIRQGQAMVEAVHKAGITWQTGSWQRSTSHMRKACELVRNGRLGRVHTVKVGLPTGKSIEPQPSMPVPEGFDYDFWLGPAPEAPYHEKRCHGEFRWNFDYSGGQLTDWAAHHCDIANWAMDTEGTGPVEVSGTGEFPTRGMYNTAINYTVECKFSKEASPVSPDGFTMILSNSFANGVQFEGEAGQLFVSREELKTTPENLKDSKIGKNEIQLYKSSNHAKNFLDCVVSGKPTITPIHVAHRAISNAHLGNMAMKLGRPIQWDPKAECVVDDPQAERLMVRSMRGHWHL